MKKGNGKLPRRVGAWIMAAAMSLTAVPVSTYAAQTSQGTAASSVQTTSPGAALSESAETNDVSADSDSVTADAKTGGGASTSDAPESKASASAEAAAESSAAESTESDTDDLAADPTAIPTPVKTTFTPATPDETSDDAAAEKNGLTKNTQDGTILHAWCWSFDTIKDNMADIAAAGFSTVQTSPANACVDEYPGKQLMTFNADGSESNDGTDGCWWWQYQPTDWTIGNYQLGTEDDFKAMCAEADKYGIKVIVDVIPNHTTPRISDVSENLFAAAGGNNADTDTYIDGDNSHTTTYATGLYHKNAFTSIVNWGDRLECTTQMMGGLPDVNTENPYFQDYFLNYINELIADGADGMRYDTAKHIGVPTDPKDEYTTENGWTNNFWPVIVGQEANLNGTKVNTDGLYIYGEVLAGDNVPTEEYHKYLNTTASSYGSTLRTALANGNLSAGTLSSLQTDDASKSVTWVESHDTYCNSHESGNLSDKQIELGWAIIAARGTGTPLFYSRPDGEDSVSGNYYGNNVLGAKGNDTFKSDIVKAANFFRNDLVGQSEAFSNPIDGNSSLLMITRGAAGVALVNAGAGTEVSAEVPLQDGSYKDKVSGSTWTVADGTLSGTIGESTAVFLEDLTSLDAPTVTATSSTGSSSFQDDTLDVILNVTNGSDATYTTSEGASGSFKDGDKITIGAKTEAGNNITVTVYAVGTNGSRYRFNYGFTKTVPNTAYIVLPDGWDGDNLYCYAYSSSSNAAWPGVKMEPDENEPYAADGETWYKYTVPADITNPRVIFWSGTDTSDNSHRYPADQAPGLSLNGSMIFRYTDDTHWKWYKYGAVIPTSTPTPTPVTGLLSYADGSQDVYAYVNSGWTTPLYLYAWADGGTEFFGSWPGKEMTKLGADDDGNIIYYYHNDGTLKTGNIIVNDNSGKQTDNTAYTAGTSVILTKDGTVESTASKTFDAYIAVTDGWTEPVHMYAYDDAGGNNGEWPGVEMYYLGKNDDGEDVFGADLPDTMTNGHVIFVDDKGQNRSTPDGQAGLDLTNDVPYIFDASDSSWKPYETRVTPSPTNTPTPTATPVPQKAVIDGSHDVYAYVPADYGELRIYYWTNEDTEKGIAYNGYNLTWPGDTLTYLGYDENKEDVYYYDFPDGADNVNVIFNNNNKGSQSDTYTWNAGDSKLFKLPDWTDVVAPTPALLNVYRLYNPNDGTHLFTTDEEEKDYIHSVGWNYEGIAWQAPATGSEDDQVYRLYNPNSGEHFYTKTFSERFHLVSIGWRSEGVAFYRTDTGTDVYRVYNPNAKSGTHHFTTNKSEYEYLVKIGWKDEGTGWLTSVA